MHFTNRDLSYLQAIYYLGGNKVSISPTKLSSQLKVSKVTAYQKMKRLVVLGFGNYKRQKGFKMNNKSINDIEKFIFQHHVLEHFFTKTLGVSCSQACNESSQITANLSDEFITTIFEMLGEPANCNCGCKIPPPYEKETLKGCSWCQQSLGANK